jgi:hypothetical protein
LTVPPALSHPFHHPQHHLQSFFEVKSLSFTVQYCSLRSVFTLTKWIIFFFQMMNSFSNFETIIFSITYYTTVIWVPSEIIQGVSLW